MEASHKTHRPHIKEGKDDEEEDDRLFAAAWVKVSYDCHFELFPCAKEPQF